MHQPGARAAVGAMYEINLLVWPAVYAVAGATWVGRLGDAGAWIGAIVGIVLGVLTAAPLISRLYYDIEILAPLLLGATWLLPVHVRPAWLAGLCVAPWIRIAIGDALARRRPRSTP
jgi:hypothetical protein